MTDWNKIAKEGTEAMARHAAAGRMLEPHQGVRIWRDSFGNCHANVPHIPVHHSPTGFEIGYLGSGPAELALCILNTFVPATGKEDRVKCYRGHCSTFAWNHHQDFKVEFLAYMAKAGGEIPADVIRAWIEERRS